MMGLDEARGTKSSAETITYDPWQRSCSSSWRLVRYIIETPFGAFAGLRQVKKWSGGGGKIL